jgi:hypothetical protein
LVGDNKNAGVDPEVVSPLSKLQDIMGNSNREVIELLAMILEVLKAGDKNLILKLGETEFGRAAIKTINKVQRQTGKTLLIV